MIMMDEMEGGISSAGQKYWGEEQSKDAVYVVYLKKVRYVPPAQFEGLPHYRPIDPDSYHIAEKLLDASTNHLQWETIREKVIKAGTLEKLVECLVSVGSSHEERQIDSRHFNVFFATYRAYSSATEVLDILLNWYERLRAQRISEAQSSPREVIIANNTLSVIRSIIFCWMDMYYEDFYSQPVSSSSKRSSSSHPPQSPSPPDDFPLISRLAKFSNRNGLPELGVKVAKLKENCESVSKRGGPSATIPRISASGNHPQTNYLHQGEYPLVRHLAEMFDVGRENSVQIAEQLTFWDSALFQELKPYQCQGGIWGRRNKKGVEDRVYSVRATIDQFNALSQRVMTSVVLPECSAEHRAKIIEKWIDIARELRALKNFSSLKAVVSSLQSEPVYRLRNTWSQVSKFRASMVQFKELASIFDIDENGYEQKARCLLDAEGTAKSSPLKRPQLVQNCKRTRSDVNLAESYGTVPYLGSFLTDLTMLDQAHFDKTPDGLWNFEKRRREFEVLAKIRLFQEASRSYTIPMVAQLSVQMKVTYEHHLGPSFLCLVHTPAESRRERMVDDYFHSISYARSLEIEPTNPTTSTPRERRRDKLARKLQNGYCGSPTLPVPRVAALAKMFGNIRVDDDGVGRQDIIRDCADNSSRSADSRTPQLRRQNRHRSNSSVPSTPASTLPRRNAGDGSLDRYLTASEFDPCLHAVHPYLLFPPSPYVARRRKIYLPPIAKSDDRSRYSSYLEYHDGFVLGGQRFDGVEKRLPRYSSSEERKYSSTNRIKTAAIHRPESSVSSVEVAFSPGTGGSQTQLQDYLKKRLNGGLVKSGASPSPSSQSSFDGSVSNSMDTTTGSNISPTKDQEAEPNFYYARVGVDDNVEGAGVINYKCIKCINGDRMSDLIKRALEKHLLDVNQFCDYCLVQLLPDGSDLELPEHCNPYYAVAPDPASRMLNFLLRRKKRVQRAGEGDDLLAEQATPSSTKRANREKRNNLLRWSSGYL